MTFAYTSRDYARTSDNERVQVFRKTRGSALPLGALLSFANSHTFDPKQSRLTPMSANARSEFVTTPDLVKLPVNQCDTASLVAGLVPRLRMLRAVVERLPQHFTPYKHLPEYRLIYYIERLSCGHERIYYPQSGPMAKRRKCAECSAANSLPPKKSPQAVTDQSQEAMYGD